jgi:hypothetical protein
MNPVHRGGVSRQGEQQGHGENEDDGGSAEKRSHLILLDGTKPCRHGWAARNASIAIDQ